MELAVRTVDRRRDGRHALEEADLSELQLYRLPVQHAALGIVAEMPIRLSQSDAASYLLQKPKWTPTLTSAGSSFRMKDFLTFAGVDPASRGQ